MRSSGEQAMRADVARRLLIRRTWLRLTQQDVADKAGVSRNFVSAIERGVQGLDVWRLSLVAEALDVTLDWLLYGPDSDLTTAVPGRTSVRTLPGT